MSKKTCLVTGGAGFIGCAISRELADHFGRVVVVDSLHPQIHAEQKRPDALDPRVDFIHRDITDASTWDAVFADTRPDVIVHLAAETGTGQSLTESNRHAHVNVVGTTTLLDGLSRHGIAPERIVLSSSRAVYGEGAWLDAEGRRVYPGQRSKTQLERGDWDFPGLRATAFTAESTEPHPTSVYGATKLAQEHVIRAWSLAFGSNVSILRLQNVYGPGQSLINSYTGILSLFVRLAREGKVIPLYEDGEMLRDFVFIEDVARAISLAAKTGTPTSDAYDIGIGEGRSIAYAAQFIAHHYSAPAPEVCGKYRHGDVRHASTEISRTTRDLGWRPAVGVDEGLSRLIVWIEGQLGKRT
jgi:dTDP-L-rhamnose 4-epimerase